MYLNTTVKIPEIKGKILPKKKGTTTYILYQYGSEYRPVNITVQMYPCSEGTDTGSPAL